MQRIDPSTLLFTLLAVGAGGAVGWLHGPGAVWEAAQQAGRMTVWVAPIVVAAVLISGYFQVLVPRAVMERWLGRGSGVRGMVLATLAGALTPGGPFAAFPLVVGLLRAGASFAVAVTFLTAWAVLGINRVLVWEIPFFGFDFVLLRLLVSLPLPFIAGGLAWLLAARVRRLREFSTC